MNAREFFDKVVEMRSMQKAYDNRPRKPTGFSRGMNWTANHIL